MGLNDVVAAINDLTIEEINARLEELENEAFGLRALLKAKQMLDVECGGKAMPLRSLDDVKSSPGLQISVVDGRAHNVEDRDGTPRLMSPENIDMTVRRVVTHIGESSGLTIAQLAELFDVRHTYIERIVYHKRLAPVLKKTRPLGNATIVFKLTDIGLDMFEAFKKEPLNAAS